MADYRSWEDFDVIYPPTDTIPIAAEGHPSDEDGIIQARALDIVDTGFIEFGLQTNVNITWWKSLRAYSGEGNDIGQVAMQDADHGPRWLRVETGALPGGRLDVEKAKAFGVHTAMYSLYFDEMPHRSGTRYTFQWHRDS